MNTNRYGVSLGMMKMFWNVSGNICEYTENH